MAVGLVGNRPGVLLTAVSSAVRKSVGRMLAACPFRAMAVNVLSMDLCMVLHKCRLSINPRPVRSSPLTRGACHPLTLALQLASRVLYRPQASAGFVGQAGLCKSKCCNYSGTFH